MSGKELRVKCRLFNGAYIAAATVILLVGGVTACSSNRPTPRSSIPPMKATASVVPTESASKTGSEVASSESSSPDLSSLSSPEVSFSVVGVPSNLSNEQEEVLLAFIKHDRSTWEMYRSMNDDFTQVQASTVGAEFSRFMDSYNKDKASGYHRTGSYGTDVSSVELDSAKVAASVGVCSDQTKVTLVSMSGEDKTTDGMKHKFKLLYSLKKDNGVWKVSNSELIGVDEC